jgi:hypothetical protein
MSSITEEKPTLTKSEALQMEIAEHVVEQQLKEDPALKASPYRVEEAARSAMDVGGIIARTMVERLEEQREKQATSPNTPSL